MTGLVRVAVASDEEAPLLQAILTSIEALGHEAVRLAVGQPWPEVGRAVAEEVASGRAARGVVCCWTGTGVCMAANKVAGVRAALCTDPETAAGARRWNDANVLALSLRLTTGALAGEILSAFFSTAPDPAEAAVLSSLEGEPAS